jgi:hypothetical protein
MVGFAVSVHPGTVATDIVELQGPLGRAQQLLSPLFLRSPAQAAACVLRAAFGAQPHWRPSGGGGGGGSGDPWLRYANGQGVVLPPSALALKKAPAAAGSVDVLARALWAASQAALDKALR